MLTGDNKTTAEAVARKLGIKEVEADALPRDKNRIVNKLTAEGRIVAMAGDGVNDARLWPKPLLVSPWGQELRSQSRVQGLPWSKAILRASRGP